MAAIPKNPAKTPKSRKMVWRPLSSDYYGFVVTMPSQQSAVSAAVAKRRKPDISIADLMVFGRVARLTLDGRGSPQKRAASEIDIREDVVSEAISRLERGMKRKLISSTTKRNGAGQIARRRGTLTDFGLLFAENCWLIERFWIRLVTVGMVEPRECLYYLRSELAMWKFADAAVNRPDEWRQLKFLLEPEESIPDILGHEIQIAPSNTAEDIVKLQVQEVETQLKKELGPDNPIWDIVEGQRILRQFKKMTKGTRKGAPA